MNLEAEVDLVSVRTALKKIPLTNFLGMRYRTWQQERLIQSEQAFYEQAAERARLSKDFSQREVKEELSTRLMQRGLVLKPRPKGDLHILYASRPGPWDAEALLPALSVFGDVSTYFSTERGYAPENEASWGSERERMGRDFVAFVKEAHARKPIDLLLTYFSGYDVQAFAIKEIGSLGVLTATFHLDDRLSFRGGRIRGDWTGPAAVCRAYDLNLTQAPESLVKYRVEEGISYLWPLAADHHRYYPRETEFKYDVSFVGSAHGYRKPMIQYLQKRGINVATFGKGWPNGFISASHIPEVFSASRINLSFDDISYSRYQCCKCRDFEIPMTGALMLSTHNPHLGLYFELGKEVFTFNTKEQCVDQIHRLLADEELCHEARRSVLKTARRQHSWEDRVAELLNVCGLLYPGLPKAL